jgi:AraC-like DNA-binding protein
MINASISRIDTNASHSGMYGLMPDALAALFADACPTARHIPIDSEDWRVDLRDGAALHVVVLLGGGGSVSSSGVRRSVATGDVVVTAGGALAEVSAEADAPRPHHVLVGSYDVTGSVCDRALTGLPEVIVNGATAQTAALTALLAAESGGARAGRDAVLIRGLDLLAVSAIRDWMEAHPDVSPAWASAHKDPVVSRALELIHADPGGPWTLESLAQQSGSSRSALSRRFTKVLGESPMSYLACWRLCLASDLLEKTDQPLAAIAARVGYANPYAFSAAFQRSYGLRPGAHRRGSRSVRTARANSA